LVNEISLYYDARSKKTLQIGGHVIRTVKYADDIVLLAKKETMLQGIIDRLTGSGSCHGLEMNVYETKIKRISRQPSAVRQIKNWRMWSI